MKRASKIGLLFSVFSLLCAMALSSGMSSASQGSERATTQISTHLMPVSSEMRKEVMCQEVYWVPTMVSTWDEKYKAFEGNAESLRQELVNGDNSGPMWRQGRRIILSRADKL